MAGDLAGHPIASEWCGFFGRFRRFRHRRCLFDGRDGAAPLVMFWTLSVSSLGVLMGGFVVVT